MPPPGGRRFAMADVPAEPTAPSPLERLGLACASVAHDFNNLLSVINVCAGEIADEAESRVQRERAGEIRDAAGRGADLTRRLLRSDGTSAPAAEAAPVAADEAIVDCLALLRRTLPGSVDLSLSSEGQVPHVMLARGELERMLLNLAANSRDALPDGGTVAIRTALVTVEPGDPVLPVGWCVRIAFSDDGEGMAPEVASRAVDALYTTKPAERGSGLGLATVNAIARLRGGDMRINSSAGAGTTVAIYLPAVRAGGEPLALARPTAT